MELVYLWVEEYKNIKNQGFNFSSKFEFHYDKDSKKLTKVRDESTTYKSIFPNNINITAIVGENGSGKSNTLNILHKGLRDYDFKGFGIFSDKKGAILYLDNLSEYPFLDKQYTKLESTLVFPLFDYSLTFDIHPDKFKKFVYPKNNGIIDLRNELIKNQKNILLNYFHLKEKNQLSKFSNFFMPKTINIYFDISKIKTSYDSTKQTQDSKELLEKLIAIIRPNMAIDKFIETLKKILRLLTDKNSYEKNNTVFDIFTPNFMLGSSNEEQKKYNMWQSEIDLKSLSEINTIKYINSNDKWITNANFQIFSFDIDKLDYKIIEVLIASFSSEHFIIQLCDEKNKKLNNLSFGEQQLLFILNQLYSLGFYLPIFEVELPRYSNEGINEFIILLDEIEIGFHPDWQKRIISYILDFLKLLPHINFHLIFTTHSPFLLSDIPKENIVFLKQGKQVKIDIDTFGANIHTLLSDGFFMSDGLMGEFAKSKIRTIQITYKYILHRHKQKSLNKKEYKKSRRFIRTQLKTLWYIQSIIGEKFLQTIMKNYLHEIEEILFGNEKAIDNEIERLQKLKKSIKNAKA